MSRSPLSGAFAGSSEPAKKNKKNGALLLISGIALATSIGGVFAATSSISINGLNRIEFGQGAAAVDSCAATATVSMAQTFSADEFYVGVVTVTFASGCDGKNATVTLLNSGGTPITSGSFTEAVTTNEVENDFASANIVASTVDDITITTSDPATP
jgi:uncharacterized membrane protein